MTCFWQPHAYSLWSLLPYLSNCSCCSVICSRILLRISVCNISGSTYTILPRALLWLLKQFAGVPAKCLPTLECSSCGLRARKPFKALMSLLYLPVLGCSSRFTFSLPFPFKSHSPKERSQRQLKRERFRLLPDLCLLPARCPAGAPCLSHSASSSLWVIPFLFRYLLKPTFQRSKIQVWLSAWCSSP